MAKDTVAKVKKLFLMQPTLAAEMSEIKRMKASGHQLSPECLSHYAQVENMYMALQSFYLLLSREQAEIIRMHFVGKLTWEAMEIEYEKKWGKMNAKNIRRIMISGCQRFTHMNVVKTVNT